MLEPSMINTGVLQRNPFPGSRPFSSAEDQLFFGRDKAVSELMEILLRRRFVALVGASASGKTSLIQSGVIPALLSDMKKEWVPIYIRPGKRPLESMVRSVQQVFSKKISEADVLSFLNSSKTIGDFIIEKGLGNYYYFLVVDQFEELFTWPLAAKRRKSGKNPDSLHFINHLMRLLDEEKPRIYLMLSVRSEFLDHCSSYRVLTEHLNRSKYLLPKMNRTDIKEAILEPIRMAGTTVESGFEEYLLNDLEEVEPQLPLLQHALKQTWNHWKSKGGHKQPISLDDYQSGGAIRNSLSRDLESIYDSLEFYQKEICERIFKTIAFKTVRQEAFGRRTSIGNISRIAQCKVDRVVEVVDIFNKTGHAFLENQTAGSLSSESEIELSHESLITIWDRLHQWVDEEDESIRMYLKLSRASASYQQGKGKLLEFVDLQKALDWKKLHKPTPAWGIQFDPAFERAMVFLSTSEEEYIWNEKRKILLERRKRILNRSLLIGSIVIVTAVALVFFISRNRPVETDQQVQTLVQEELPERTPDNQEQALIDEDLPLENEESEQGEVLSSEVIPAEQEESNIDAVAQVSEATSEAAPQERSNNMQSEGPGTIGSSEERVLALAIVKDVAYMSTGISKNPELQGLLAYQSYKLNKSYGGDDFDTDIYHALYEALKKLISPAYNIYPKLRHSIKAMEWLNGSGSILTACGDGSMKILSGNIADRAAQIDLAGTGLNNECLGISPDESIAAIGTNGGGMLFVELENNGDIIHQNREQGDIVLFIQNLGNSGSFLSAGTDKRILKWNYNDFTASTLLSLPDRPVSMTSSEDGSKLAIGTRNGKLYTLDVNTPSSLAEIRGFGSNSVRAMAFAPGQRYLAAGLLDGSLRVLSGDGKTVIASLFGPGARVRDIKFSPDGRFLVAASNDGNVYMWNTGSWGNPPTVFTENNGFVLSLCFSGNSSFFYSGSIDYPRMVGRPTNPEQMAKDFCSLLSRNLSPGEWDQYFGKDIPYEETCPR
jgi:Novel STAND NTPase 1/WD domain, G-beta repeat